MATVTKPIALDESLNTTELSPRNIADVLADGLADVVTALGGGSLEDLSDVSITTPSDGQILVYDGNDSEWKNENAPTIPTVNDATLTLTQNGSTLGTFTANASSNVTIDVPGGGGGGGHTILDDAGTSLAQEPSLQFKGVPTSDDAVNSKTVVEIVREMTKADFDLLSDAEKIGIIHTTDEPDNPFLPGLESVSMTADGVKTWKTLLNELWALADKNKITRNAVFASKGGTGFVTTTRLALTAPSPNESYLFVSHSQYNTSTHIATIRSVYIDASNSYIMDTASSVSDYTNTVASSGVVLTLYYNIVASPVVDPTVDYVEVVGDGTKTKCALLNELYSLVDASRIDGNSYIYMEDLSEFFHISRQESNHIDFYCTLAWGSAPYVYAYRIYLASTSSLILWSSSGSTDQSSEVYASGNIIRLYY